jgi:hypothetical protein
MGTLNKKETKFLFYYFMNYPNLAATSSFVIQSISEVTPHCLAVP